MNTKTLIAALLMVLCTGCLTTERFSRGPGSVTYDIRIDQRIDGLPVNASAKVQDKYTTSGGINITIVSYERDKTIETADDNSAAKNATSATTPSVTVTPIP